MAIGPGSLFARSAALGMLDNENYTAEDICRRAMRIAGDMSVYTNH